MKALLIPKLNQRERKIVGLAALGGMLEFYDFVIYGIFSVYFAYQFFPNDNALITVIESYVIFMLGYIARPIGGIIFSHIGDEYGRKKVLVITIILMGLASLGIGLLPTYSQIGVLAPILMLILRLVQGLAIGGELPSTYVYISESIPLKRGISFGITMTGVNAGLLLGTLINYLLTTLLTVEQLHEWGWRIPFILGGLLCLISYKIRKTLHETQEFRQIKYKTKLPIALMLKNHLPQTIIGIALTSIMAGLVVTAIIFMPNYLLQILNIDEQQVGYIMPIVMAVNVTVIYCVGLLASRITCYKIFKYLLITAIVFTPLAYWMIQDLSLIIYGAILLAIIQGGSAMLVPMVITHLFPAEIRLTGVAFCYNIGFTIFGGLAPITIGSLINLGYNPYIIPAAYLLTIFVIASVGLFFAKKYSFEKIN